MSLEQLWAGWRAAYVSSVSDPHPESLADRRGPAAGGEVGGATPGEGGGDAGSARERLVAEVGPGGDPSCVFCRIAATKGADEALFVVWRGPLVLAMLNAYPYAPGHLMVMPARHVGELEQLERQESAELWAATEDAVRALKAAYRQDGTNIGINLGRAAGAGIPAHLHVHVVPRWIGDTNFTTATASLRVLPEAITDSWSKLHAAWPR